VRVLILSRIKPRRLKPALLDSPLCEFRVLLHFKGIMANRKAIVSGSKS
jgi:hypothetical protein